MDILAFIGLLIMVIGIEVLITFVYLLYRNRLIYRFRIKACDMIYAHSNGLNGIQAHTLYESFGDYDTMFLSHLEWYTFEKFYPNLEQRIKDAVK